MEGLGFTFWSYNAHDMLDAIRRGINLYHDAARWDVLRRNAMANDCSWKHSVESYWQIYRSML